MRFIEVYFCKRDEDVIKPKYETEKSAGMDVRAYLPNYEYPEGKIEIRSGETKIIPTGFKVAIPDGYEIQVRPRSGLSAKTKLRIANSPGTIDSDYRGEVGIIVDNISIPTHKTLIQLFMQLFWSPFRKEKANNNVEIINHGDRIAQIVFCPIVHAILTDSKTLDGTKRNEGGFGSTGTK